MSSAKPAPSSAADRMELAPLKTLQSNQRRGSITDPVLHTAASSSSTHKRYGEQHNQTQEVKSHRNSPRPASPYVFGDATRDAAKASESRGSPGQAGSTSKAGSQAPEDYKMAVDADEPRQASSTSKTTSKAPTQGKKRKAAASTSLNTQEIDPQLVGPGVPSPNDGDVEPPAPKRRGSAVENTQKIADLSLHDRRNSVDSRVVGSPWWMGNGRRDGGAMFSAPPGVAGYGPGFTGESSHARHPHPHPPGIASFAWPPHPPLDQPPGSHPASTDPAMSATQRPFDPNVPPAMTMIHPIPYAPHDRRMSVPNIVSGNAPGPTRALRSRSRPPSRQVNATVSDQASPSASPGAQTDAASPGMSSKGKEPGVSPYSRSPELRVSHKLAERKRRKEMKDLFDELRDQLPADRGMKASKWEILSKAIDFVAQLKQSHQDMAQEIDILRHELDGMRQASGLPPLQPGTPMVYSQGPPIHGQYPAPPLHPTIAHQPAQPPPPPHLNPSISRPSSSQNSFTPPSGVSEIQQTQQNGNSNRTDPTSAPAPAT